jgi:DNA adenine methylase
MEGLAQPGDADEYGAIRHRDEGRDEFGGVVDGLKETGPYDQVQQALAIGVVEEPTRPFLKWAGGKRQLLPELERYVPRGYPRYFEPFIGGGALFFRLQPPKAVLADVNERLIRTYRGVKKNVDDVIRLLKDYPHNEKFFYELRDVDIDARTDAEVAAWFIYLNKTGFNGLYRVNRRNRFNVPFGRYANPTICDAATLRSCSAALAEAELVVDDFEVVLAKAKRRDFVYIDPPYMPLSITSSFTSYTSSGFGMEQQTRLRDVALRLKKCGVRILLSNSSAPDVRRLYREGFETTEVSATRQVNSKASGRGAITELVIR